MMLTHLTLALLVVGGAVAGGLGAVLGIGGGVILVPLLVIGFGVPMHVAVATSLLSVIATSSAVATTNVELGTANMRLGMTLELATAVGAVGGGLIAGALSAGVLEALFAVLLAPTALLMWRGRSAAAAVEAGADVPDVGRLGARYVDPADGRTVAYHVRNLSGGMGISFAAGGVSGLLGIGGGIFKVPALHLLCGIPMKAAAATSNFMIGVTAAASAFLYYGRGEVEPALTAAIVLGVLVGSRGGMALTARVSGPFIRRLFAVLLVVVAVQMLIRAL